jgi:hypothetical protein
MTAKVVLSESVERKIKSLPDPLDRRGIAQAFTEEFGVPYSHRTIESRPYHWQIINGRATAKTREAFTHESQRINANPEYRTGAYAKETA